MKVIVCLLGLLLLAGQSLSAQEIPTVDAIYEPNIRTVLLVPLLGNDPADPALSLNPPVINLAENVSLQLSFDDLTADYRPYRAKLLHCNADWQRSVLNDIEFTFEYNDYPIQDYQLSNGTKVPYYHYRFPVPKVKLPGNYLLVVYNERNPAQVLFTRRFSTYQTKVGISPNVQFSSGPQKRFTDQQVDFDLSYRGYPLIAPQDELKVVIRQNYRDDRVVTGLRPTNVRAFDNLLEYRLFDLKNTFPGGNEYRFFDIRTVISPASFIDRLDRRQERTLAYVLPDAPRSTGAYVLTDDFNGQYVIDQLETHNGSTQADYITTVFTLRSQELPGAEVYVNGAFNLWKLNDRNRMTYSPERGGYVAQIPLKQGVYNYTYSVKGIAPPVARSGMSIDGNEALVEGNYSATENDYEIFVYHRPPASRADQLVGYRKVGVNKRK
ncbi:type IX secretion system plug protein [Tellurirhabdus rosea]|uniref:type IX secretion system plug protein n=1 Tax=Tellurirhabdus rosea TaxID=2674997 RepID=UPI00225160C5|nr:DUF5103 domain-containing protein [Tellurirhabdus rosea]